ncbi:MAG: 1-deoxy-D-xylulose-5-phosphate reductoisomerase, partial [Candidatus Tectimicrobiota bacterium]
QVGGTMPAVLNAANEIAVQAFLDGTIPFLGIPTVIEEALAQHTSVPLNDASVALQADAWAREYTRAAIKEYALSKTVL